MSERPKRAKCILCGEVTRWVSNGRPTLHEGCREKVADLEQRLEAAEERARVATEALQASRTVMEHREQRAAEELADAHGHSYSREFVALALKARSLADAFLAAPARPPPHRSPNE